MATTEPPDRLYAEESNAEAEVDTVETPKLLHIPDLSTVPGNGLRKLSEVNIVATERYGDLYAPIFRQLQIRPDKYHDFHNGVIRVVRRKQQAEIRRATGASIKTTTDYLLRAFGYIVWTPNSEWLLDEKDLDEGEARLLYWKNKAVDPRFHPVCKSLWRQMRNVQFTRRATPHRGQSSSDAPTVMADGDESYMGDIDSGHPSPHSRARATAMKKIEDLSAEVARRLPAPSRMNADQTEEAIIDLITRSATIRANSDPKIFEELWQAHIMRVEELEEEIAHGGGPIANSAVENLHPAVTGNQQNATSPSNEPFNTSGLALAHSYPSTLAIAPALPSIMSVYISMAQVASPIRNPAPSTAAAPMTPAYHWPSAPVENHHFVNFFTGINYRVDVPSARILGRVQGEMAGNTADVRAHDGNDNAGRVDQEVERAKDMTDVNTPASATTTPTFAPNEAKSKEPEDFTIPEWQTMALGWRDFQNDLRYAAQSGVRVWRMKVCVITVHARDMH
ncbi:hypothetical protein G647_08514 [Cladophialophora carrionii CBS 160.54]|uniref:Uncharacterized protein n=1 Tax=Cladophialophora carrionii CBS 160.54 TaxID=1279043 RepID=V9D3A5_9EURO|nr:uncharacterized protein G647_08514 [Cladophialophora carrionii CBS 160.54]ETI20477.1 hypothetical protein G647_08514 [Cladophialophora carrionii CBS 160.54]